MRFNKKATAITAAIETLNGIVDDTRQVIGDEQSRAAFRAVAQALSALEDRKGGGLRYVTDARRASIAARLEAGCAQRGWSIRRFASEAGVSYYAAWAAITGNKGAGLATMAALERALEASEADPTISRLLEGAS